MSNRLGDAALTLLSREWAGLAGAAALGGAAAVAYAAGARRTATVLGVGAGVLAFGATTHLRRLRRVAEAYPPPGRLVDVGGFRLHVLAEGEPGDAPPIVLFAGSHQAGYAVHHLHRALRERTRSILVDRAGSGWSDAGPFPRTTAREAGEIVVALEAAGERGPFVVAGHSFGGLLAANIARRRPDLIAAVVLLDATPPDTILYLPVMPGPHRQRRDAVVTALLRLAGIDVDLNRRDAERDPYARNLMALVAERLGDAEQVMRAVESGAKAPLATASIFAEVTKTGLASRAWETVVYDGDLGDLPVFLVAPGSVHKEVDAMSDRDMELGAGDDEARRMRHVLAITRERYLRTSSRAERVYAPEGTGHLFPFEAPEFTVDVLLRAQRAVSAAPPR